MERIVLYKRRSVRRRNLYRIRGALGTHISLARVKVVLPLCIGLAFCLLGLVLFSSTLVLLSLAPLFYVAHVLVAHLWLSPPEVEAVRVFHQQRAPEGDDVEITLRVCQSETQRGTLGIVDPIPYGTTVSHGDAAFLGTLSPDTPLELPYAVRASRGLYSFPRIRATRWSSIGLTSRAREIESSSRLHILPQVEPLPHLDIRPRKTKAFAGSVRANLPGFGTDFFGCRTYTPGDDIRRVNWRAYARTDELIISDYEQERIADVSIILDARVRAHAFIGRSHTFEFAVHAAASLASQFCDQGNSVGLMIYGDVLNWVFPGLGRTQKNRILDALSQAELADRAAFEELRRIPTRLFPARSQLVVVSCRLDEEDIETLAQLRTVGYSVLLCSLNTLPYEKRLLPEDAMAPTALDIATLRRRLYLGSLARHGLQVVDWPLGAPMYEAFRQAQQPRRRIS